jgi:hypothetical protein
MKYVMSVFICVLFVSCSKSSSSGGKKNAATPAAVVEDILSRVYNYYTEMDSDLVEKLEFFDNDTVKVTKEDGSSETLKKIITDEGEEDDTDLLLETICPAGTVTGTTEFVDMKLTNSDDSFASNLGAEVWDGTCNGEPVSCVAMVVYDEDPVTDESVPVQGYMFGLNDENGCDPIQSEVQALLDSVFDVD